ncbi:proteasome regulatory non-ATPase, putative [Bodo saltans]|uniref:Proteasome regulatory non-ATPase, putative n=1 Tax=Bodo saltans TaxID=75058 RepID=A0A0S4IM85_BODSA|nr:proteasome regulatory non-ATPase, putative [Bodo saltans]|eukprot:CUF40112.1 proteasome regulatory non-ATPase, putative [Bodo saltans]
MVAKVHDNEESSTAVDHNDAGNGEAVIPMDPLIALLHHRHAFTSSYTTAEEKTAAQSAIIAKIQENNMRPYWQLMSDMLGWPVDAKRAAEMDKINELALERLTARIKDAQDNLGDVEVREALLAKCDFYASIGDLDACLKFNEECSGKTLAPGPKLDLCFQRIRLGIAFSNNDVAAKGITDAHRLMKDGDWERRNRLKVYEGLYHVFIRDFEKGSSMLIDSLTTFASTEILDFKQFVLITVVSALPVLSRADLKKKVIDSPEVVSAGIASINELVSSIYNCNYGQCFAALDDVCQEIRRFVFMSLHVNYFFREVRVLFLNQFLDSYSSVTLTSMSAAFKIPVAVLDQMLCTLISNERVAGKIDRVSGSVTTYRGNATNFEYHRIIKQGDLLISRIQKLSRMVEL